VAVARGADVGQRVQLLRLAHGRPFAPLSVWTIIGERLVPGVV
jgi:hypothetical protein